MNLFKPLKNHIKLLWTDKATIFGVMPVKHGVITNNERVEIVKEEPCRIILNSQRGGNQKRYSQDDFDATMLISNEVKIPAGSKIVITNQNGDIVNYELSSKGYTGYYSHQEVTLNRKEKA